LAERCHPSEHVYRLVIVRKIAVVLGALLVTAAALALALSWQGDVSPDRDQGAAAVVPLTPVPVPLRHGNPPHGFDDIVPASYRELAAFRSTRGTLLHVFVGRFRHDGTSCVGLRNPSGYALGCGVLFENGNLIVSGRQAFGKERFVSGVAAPSVAMVEASDGRLLTLRVPVTNGAFVIEGRTAGVVGALDDEGRYLDR
jgi:hypothetical protein